jgi:hypothetical protein
MRCTNNEEGNGEYKTRQNLLLLNTDPYHRDRTEVAGNVPQTAKLNGLNEVKRLSRR